MVPYERIKEQLEERNLEIEVGRGQGWRPRLTSLTLLRALTTETRHAHFHLQALRARLQQRESALEALQKAHESQVGCSPLP